MKNLINFLVKNSSIFFFLGLEILSIILISNNKGYQRSVLLSSTNSVVGWLYKKNSSVVDFFSLKEVNKNLSAENIELRNKLTEAEQTLSAYYEKEGIKYSSKLFSVPPNEEYRYISAKVIRNTTNLVENYLTLNKGSNDSIHPHMGVISNGAVVGIVETVSPNFSKVISILHPITAINCKFKSNNYFGTLVWDGQDHRHAKLNDIARHVKFNKGDIIITSGLVKSFPEGILVGRVSDMSLEDSYMYYDIDVELSVDYHALTYVQVVDYLHYQEQTLLENSQYGDTINITQR